ncbi:DNA polymerase IV [Dietzia sp. ANT_WB102]|uniref:DNA polymerase IV n=1 Tax=Dietzia sp. ANT_WB102 TaxID=2597345 RepID=UPI0011EF6B58|nr:DNA polymerase IV [Dietzia sp. ANT_WB102]KAA0917276.1 DNA polymerase IV [Dietzia sp. ANT_WB102]
MGDGQDRWVLHVDMDAFFASCEQLTRPTLRGRPVLVGGTGGRGVVAGCSYEARAYGARSAMPSHQARRLVGPSAVFLPPRMPVYRALSRRVFEVFAEHAPVVEQVSVDEAFLEPPELRGADAERTRRWAQELRAAIREATGLPASVGAGAGKQYAKIASELAKPDGIAVVARRDHAEVLDPLPVRSLWGVGPVAGERLSQFGIATIGDLAAMDDDDVVQALGRTVGPAIARIARGYDDRPVHERAEAKQISAESTFAADLTTAGQVAGAVRRSAEAAHRRLLTDGRAARTVTVKVKRTDFTSITRSYTLPEGTTSLETIIAVARSLAPDPVDFGAIRLLGVGVSGLTEFHQDALFEQEFVPEGRSGPGDDDEDLPDIVGVGTTVTTDDRDPAASDAEAVDQHAPEAVPAIGAWRAGEMTRFRTGSDVWHPEFGHGWVQGSGHGRVSVRFETAATGPGRMRTFSEGDPDLEPADPLDSLGW